MPTPKQTLKTFFDAFADRDYRTMIACYTDDVHFKDEIFDIYDKRVFAMWHMLLSGADDLELWVNRMEIENDAPLGHALWEAKYTFGSTGRKVHNKVFSRFRFTEEGKIAEQIDEFSFWKWSTQVLGLPGRLLGWTPLIKKPMVIKASGALNRFIEKHPEYQREGEQEQE